MHAVADLGFQYCTPVQGQFLPEAMKGRNIAARAQTGTGKTAAFLVFMLTHLLRNPPPAKRAPGVPRALVLAPTRELVIQIVKDAENLSVYTPFRTLGLFGGMDYNKQKEALLHHAIDFAVATPGRLLDFARNHVVDLSQVEFLVIDEADRMLDMGFIPDVKDIVRRTPPKEKRRTLLFSATLTQDVLRLASIWMPDPLFIEVEPEKVTVDAVTQMAYVVSAHDKLKLLYNLLQQPEMKRVLVFSNRRDRTERIADGLSRHGLPCELLSGAVDQKKRLHVLEKFRAGEVRVLVATDVAGRGIHIDGVTHVVNFDLPYEPEDYVHRIGRTGRAGFSGTAIAFACEDESFVLPEIEKFIGKSIEFRQPDDSLLAPLPPPLHPPRAPRRPPDHGRERSRGGSSSGGGYRGSRGPRRSGSSRPGSHARPSSPRSA
jgi:ATP-dependent RNA helicase RhlB